MNHLCGVDKCTGCFVCASKCPRNAIKSETNNLGFHYPVINTVLCVDCGNCTRHCHVCSPLKKNFPRVLYKYKGLDSERLRSSSGAFFPVLSEYFLKKGYNICGVVFSEDYLSAHYTISKSKSIIDKMRKSKYVEADLGSVYEDINNLLKIDEKVVFFGLPCHVAGLLKFVPPLLQQNLLTVDLLCFGNGSPQIYKDCLTSFCKKKGSSLTNLMYVDFRHKPYINESHTIIDIQLGNTTYTLFSQDFPYYYGFVNRLVFRESCYQCEYNSYGRIADLTIGDALGVSDALGESVILFNTDKVEFFLRELIEDNDLIEMNEEEVLETKARFLEREKPVLYDRIAECRDYKKLERKYLNKNKKQHGKRVKKNLINLYNYLRKR